jgi:hypothetical protein
MYMRFIGGGVGHAETHPSPLDESGDEGIAMEMDEGNLIWEDGVAPLGELNDDAVDGDAMEEDEDVCVDSDEPDSDDDDEGEDEDDDDDDLGPDDGEEEYDDDELYAKF